MFRQLELSNIKFDTPFVFPSPFLFLLLSCPSSNWYQSKNLVLDCQLLFHLFYPSLFSNFLLFLPSSSAILVITNQYNHHQNCKFLSIYCSSPSKKPPAPIYCPLISKPQPNSVSFIKKKFPETTYAA